MSIKNWNNLLLKDKFFFRSPFFFLSPTGLLNFRLLKNFRRKKFFFTIFFFNICVQLLAPFKAYRSNFDFEIRYSRPLIIFPFLSFSIYNKSHLSLFLTWRIYIPMSGMMCCWRTFLISSRFPPNKRDFKLPEVSQLSN